MKQSVRSANLFGKVIALVLLCCLVGGFAVASVGQSALAESRQELSPADIYEQNVNSTVGITISGQTTSRYGYGYTYQASGSGFIITGDGY
ncbi:MAG: hypothetical protein IJ237_05110, partial [Oscillospiraceae bacterium]|nr:hypothetical protein [Oscillospiraceae bacterium]